MLAESVAAVLSGNNPLASLMAGGIYPTSAYPVTEISLTGTPGAFDDFGVLRPCLLVIDSGTTKGGPSALRDAAETVIDVIVWQSTGGRGVIDTALNMARKSLVGASVPLLGGSMVGFRFGGYLGPWQDEPVRAEQGRLRLVTARRLG